MPGSLCVVSKKPISLLIARRRSPNGHLKISWTSTAELEIDKISRDDLIRVHVGLPAAYLHLLCFFLCFSFNSF